MKKPPSPYPTQKNFIDKGNITKKANNSHICGINPTEDTGIPVSCHPERSEGSFALCRGKIPQNVVPQDDLGQI